jgi:hypothetical protein
MARDGASAGYAALAGHVDVGLGFRFSVAAPVCPSDVLFLRFRVWLFGLS